MEFKEIKKLIEENAPEGKVTKVDLEGPRVVLYTKDLPFFIDNNKEIRNLSAILKKRINVRSNPAQLMEVDAAEKIIREIIPEEANIIYTDFFKK